MSFTCDYCSTPQASGVKPIIVTEFRSKQYVREVSEDEVKAGMVALMDTDGSLKFASVGKEPDAEYRMCPLCADVKAPTVGTFTDFTLYKAQAQALRATHVHGCKELTNECKTCAKVIRAYAEMPLQGLSVAIENPQARAAKYSLALLAVGSMMDRTTHTRNAGAKGHILAAMAHLKPYEKRGGKL